MLELMYVRCAQCGYDNSPEFRFCGMCGGSLPHPPKETAQPERDVLLPPTPAPVPLSTTRPTPTTAPIPVSATALGDGERVHGPSFLGLSDDSREDFAYEDDDAPKRSRAGVIAAVVLLIAAASLLGWQWRHDGFPFNRTTTGSNPPAPAVVPDASQNSQTPVADKPAAGNGDQPGTAPNSETQIDSSAKPAEGATQETATASPSLDRSAPADKAASAEASPQASVPARSPAKKLDAAKPRAKSPAVESAALSTGPDADLELAGEHYLYGTGLPQNCSRAESSLGTAAAHGNSKAETVLGTMYATGHCVGRDLPAAYRWFARALHQDPQNPRISDDLQVLWRQMTPEEKRLATTSGH